MINMVIVVLLSYIVGSIPTSVMLSKWRHGFDIRSKGSGNAGGTNVFRGTRLEIWRVRYCC